MSRPTDLYREYTLQFVKVAHLREDCGGMDEPPAYEPEPLYKFRNFSMDDVDVRF